ncbi:low molecular weight phosphotyrosine protein phosphatase [Pseudomonas sp. B21-032]|uniref:low molecular weight protein-tyrosine-phosphatase n=1 Tax=unclassified Pseudomonas TaxID=196821 RepID=UPI0005EADABE|nr:MULTISPECIES: low molecular weight protein-tyrosine-phosphatase [unclassified Pseudomonas]KJK19446.1 protein tyrosine phosphatase [Pseudomonas sp. 2(2015)]QVM98195.1 low molecular weight phosphotyrosine protein phosphatase [Pseudomonas sp. SORT22]UVL60209.1 low molecular weight phosphotyrosine protein phosphatase [Pseudomonas sp. B21-032]SDQ51151.1 protein tyrosine phosphatase [Pseudomonas sp. UC 17F4]
MRVLFVCLGNICRSPTAEGVLRQQLRAEGLAELVEVASAGTGDWHVGKQPDARTCRTARIRGYDLSQQRAQQIKAAHFNDYDLILAMDKSNLGHLQGMRPATAKAELDLFLRRYDGALDEVPDPYYGAEEDFEQVLDLIEIACSRLVTELKGRL